MAGAGFLTVKEYLSAGNRFDVDAQLLLLDDSVRYEIPGIGVVEGREAVRDLLEFEAGLRFRVTMIDCRMSEARVTCDVARRDDWLAAVGISEFRSSYEFGFRGERIGSVDVEFSPYSGELMGKTLEEFIPWVMAHHPEIFTAEGSFRLGFDGGAALARAGAQWADDQVSR